MVTAQDGSQFIAVIARVIYELGVESSDCTECSKQPWLQSQVNGLQLQIASPLRKIQQVLIKWAMPKPKKQSGRVGAALQKFRDHRREMWADGKIIEFRKDYSLSDTIYPFAPSCRKREAQNRDASNFWSFSGLLWRPAWTWSKFCFRIAEAAWRIHATGEELTGKVCFHKYSWSWINLGLQHYMQTMARFAAQHLCHTDERFSLLVHEAHRNHWFEAFQSLWEPPSLTVDKKRLDLSLSAAPEHGLY